MTLDWVRGEQVLDGEPVLGRQEGRRHRARSTSRRCGTWRGHFVVRRGSRRKSPHRRRPTSAACAARLPAFVMRFQELVAVPVAKAQRMRRLRLALGAEGEGTCDRWPLPSPLHKSDGQPAVDLEARPRKL
jgi:hypothetical protein